jgi:LysM repeat protein
VVRRGDTLSNIARTLRVTVASLREWNNISGSNIRAGQKLVAYVPRRS